jgi:predicted nucleotidyltransferase
MPLDREAIRALGLLRDVAAAESRDLVVIGATVPLVLIDRRQGREGEGPLTRDVDAVIAAKTWAEFAGLKRRLVAAGFREGEEPHRLYLGTAEIDLIPYSPALAPGDRLEWPGTGFAMSTLGIPEALEHARLEQIEANLSLRMVPISGCVLLKLIAYSDRPAERVRDLTDVIHCLERYDEDGTRRFDVAPGRSVDEVAIQYEEAGAYLLGTEVATIARAASLRVVRTIVDAVKDDDAGLVREALRGEARHVDRDKRAQYLCRLFRVFSAGLGEAKGAR